ncbi:uncharacterized protein LOC106947326 isoform X2 [Poecilia latipinna]|uniref:uncharacterized protein LOC106947326 isoform X2 n=1 Tax=Poecilia latipinna TaxID=48699 RepID=UPI00072E6965|nr:PREDICTED: uncharacterized protein LOC106947326 isoform X2 [Poecilia latipinna]
MTCVTSPGAPASLTACLLFVAGCFAQKVYFDCGAKVDVVDVQGLILSPGFPYNYSSGTHCVWQFVVPVDYQLVLEIFDFDVFESHDSEAQYSAFSNFEEDEEAAAEEKGKVTPTGSSADGSLSAAAKPAPQSAGDLLKTSRKGIPNQVVVQEQSSKMEIAKVSNSAKRSADLSSSQSSLPPSSLLLLPGAAPPADKVNNSVSASPSNENLSPTLNPSGVMEETTYGSPPSTGTPPVLRVQPPSQQPAGFWLKPRDGGGHHGADHHHPLGTWIRASVPLPQPDRAGRGPTNHVPVRRQGGLPSCRCERSRFLCSDTHDCTLHHFQTQTVSKKSQFLHIQQL